MPVALSKLLERVELLVCSFRDSEAMDVDVFALRRIGVYEVVRNPSKAKSCELLLVAVWL